VNALHLSWAAATHQGMKRPTNEDSLCARPDLGLFVVADGMGGHAAGEVASRLAVETIEGFIEATGERLPDQTWPVAWNPELSAGGNRLCAAFALANRRLAEEARRRLELRGMATTASAILFDPAGESASAHVGDSRIYLLRGGELRRHTHDHSWVEEQVRAGMLDPRAASQHPWRNVVTRALSGSGDPEVDVAPLALDEGDLLLLCSDGLFGVVPDERLAEALSARADLQGICDDLIALANAAGGPDNITVLVLRVDAP
jgi:serine/threonine protein phosphatase PrpC